MEKRAIDVAKALARLSELTIFELRGEWRRHHRMPPPMRFSRDLLTRGISYKLQERAYGGLSTATARKLGRASADPLGRGAVKPAPPISLKSGTRLVRVRIQVQVGSPGYYFPVRENRHISAGLSWRIPVSGRVSPNGAWAVARSCVTRGGWVFRFCKQPLEVGENIRDERGPPRIFGGRRLRKQDQKITGLGHAFTPAGGRCGGKKNVQFLLAQRGVGGVDHGELTPQPSTSTQRF